MTDDPFMTKTWLSRMVVKIIESKVQKHVEYLPLSGKRIEEPLRALFLRGLAEDGSPVERVIARTQGISARIADMFVRGLVESYVAKHPDLCEVRIYDVVEHLRIPSDHELPGLWLLVEKQKSLRNDPKKTYTARFIAEWRPS